MAEVSFAGEMFRRIEHRVMQFAELDLDVALLGDLERVRTASGTSWNSAFISSADRR
jgi:hypothetical protein